MILNNYYEDIKIYNREARPVGLSWIEVWQNLLYTRKKRISKQETLFLLDETKNLSKEAEEYRGSMRDGRQSNWDCLDFQMASFIYSEMELLGIAFDF